MPAARHVRVTAFLPVELFLFMINACGVLLNWLGTILPLLPLYEGRSSESQRFPPSDWFRIRWLFRQRHLLPKGTAVAMWMCFLLNWNRVDWDMMISRFGTSREQDRCFVCSRLDVPSSTHRLISLLRYRWHRPHRVTMWKWEERNNRMKISIVIIIFSHKTNLYPKT